MTRTTNLKELNEPTEEYIVIGNGKVFETDAMGDAITFQNRHGGTIYARLKTGHEKGHAVNRETKTA